MFTLTKNEFLENEKNWFIKNESIEDYNNLLSALKKEYFDKLIAEMKKGSTITNEVFQQLDSMEQYYFNKHFNQYNNKVIF